MAQFHFVEDYERLVEELIRTHQSTRRWRARLAENLNGLARLRQTSFATLDCAMG